MLTSFWLIATPSLDRRRTVMMCGCFGECIIIRFNQSIQPPRKIPPDRFSLVQATAHTNQSSTGFPPTKQLVYFRKLIFSSKIAIERSWKMTSLLAEAKQIQKSSFETVIEMQLSRLVWSSFANSGLRLNIKL